MHPIAARQKKSRGGVMKPLGIREGEETTVKRRIFAGKYEVLRISPASK